MSWGGGGGGGGGREAESNDRKKAWPSINSSIISGSNHVQLNTKTFTVVKEPEMFNCTNSQKSLCKSARTKSI